MTNPGVSTAPDRLSPEEVAAMSDVRLATALCKAFGWEWKHEIGGAAARAWTRYPLGAGWKTGWNLFLPSDPVAVEHVREHMRGRWRATARDWVLRGYRDVHGSGWSAGVENIDGDIEICAYAPSLGRAIFEAAALAAQEMQQTVSQATPDNEPRRGVARCLVHHEDEPCGMCASYIAGGL